jgi:hypothetical protein
MRMRGTPQLLLWRWCSLLAFVWLLAAGVTLRGAEVSVRASVNRLSSVIGDPVQFQIKVTGARNAGNPPEVAVDGLQIQYAGYQRSSSAQIDLTTGFSNFEPVTTWVYQVVPERNGSFTIPAVDIVIAGKTYRTEPIKLKVQPSSAGSDDGKVTFAELSVAKKSVFLGEAIPAELRLYIDSRVRRAQPLQMPEIGGDGFTKEKFPEPREEQVEKNGRDYNVIVFKTLVSPSRAGKVLVGPSEIEFTARVPKAAPDPFRSPFGGLGDLFNDPMFSAVQQMKAKAEPVELTVKPLPQTGKPADFSGAVGDFHLEMEGSPRQVKVGDPVTVKLKISGKGNFDRVIAPALIDSNGWRLYPPATTFNAGDSVNFTGTKTFEMQVIPETKKKAMPSFQFSYFDPLKEKYVVLKSEPLPLEVQGGAILPPQPSASAADTAPPEAKPPAAEPRPNDILGLRYDLEQPQNFVPWYERREFWYAQGALAVVLVGVAAFRFRRAPDPVALQRAALRHERDAVWRRLRATEAGHIDFFDAAARLAQIDTALATGRPVAGVDAAAVRAALPLDEEAAATIEEIFNARAAFHYAGGGGDQGTVSPEERARVLGVLKQLEKSRAK